MKVNPCSHFWNFILVKNKIKVSWLKDNDLSPKHSQSLKMKNQEILLCCHGTLNATILLYPEGNRVCRMVGHLITREESHQILVTYILLLITLSKIFKIVQISCHEKKTILTQVVEYETFTLSTHEVLGCWCSLVPWWQCGWRKGLSFLGSFYLEVVLMFWGGWGMFKVLVLFGLMVMKVFLVAIVVRVFYCIDRSIVWVCWTDWLVLS